MLVANNDFREHQSPLALASGGGLGILQRATVKDQKSSRNLARNLPQMERRYAHHNMARTIDKNFPKRLELRELITM